ncbi:MAG: hypothetical protein CVU11_02725 [Bacteroidetes bacterium HGW-Bacteroidetes-6]|jgi:thiol-disulfide isomerase/thioredoxin|nr:MAG: hypothetical protein CVU12_04460 [Bacteroidetes bacterium HGW-Bacteroidetes-7]PKP04840.1 MAG: hypothetical protein CVU11_02725 [Bacteroidetes bacterium HGW-Bacteroidetes-6]
MTLKNTFLIFTIWLLFPQYYCWGFEKENENNSNKGIVLIIKNAPIQKSFQTPGGLTRLRSNLALFSYIDDSGNSVLLYTQKEQDTLRIDIKLDFLELKFLYQGCESTYFLLKNKDTVSFDFDSTGYPSLKSSLSPELTSMYNFPSSIKSRKLLWDLEPLTLLFDFGHNVRTVAAAKQRAPELFEKWKADYVCIDILKDAYYDYIKNYKSTLDSLYSLGEMPVNYKEYYDYQLYRKQWTFYISEFYYDRKKISELSLPRTNSTIYDFLNDKLLYYSSYCSFLSCFSYPYLHKANKIPSVKLDNKSYIDYRTAFDSISVNKKIPPKSRNLLLYYKLVDINQYFAQSDIIKYSKKYLDISGDSIGLKKILSTNETKLTINPTVADLQLIDNNGKTLTIKDVFDKHKGKVIYIDFWASWCTPCIQGMPDSKKLRQEYSGKNIVFIFLAKSDKLDIWKTKNKELIGNDLNSESYFITNSKTSKMLKMLTIEAIPRFLLYDRNGVIVHKNAPRPHSKEIRELFEKYLNK